jgi:hypothetical protein
LLASSPLPQVLGHEELICYAWGNISFANLSVAHSLLQSACEDRDCAPKHPVPGPNFQRRLFRAQRPAAAVDLFRLAVSRFAQNALGDAMQWLGKAIELGVDAAALRRRNWGLPPELSRLHRTPPLAAPAPHMSVWTFDMHHGAIADHLHKVKYMLLANATVHDFQVTNDCHRDVPTQGLRGWCPDDYTDLLLYPTALTLCPAPNRKRRLVFERIRKDARVLAADVFICTLPIANCQLFMPLDKPMILVTCFQFHYGRQRDDYYKQLLDDLKRLARDPKHVLAASHFYDVEYTRFLTGIEIEYLPLLAAYVNTTYTPMNSVFLIGNYRAPKVCPHLVEAMLAVNQDRQTPFDIMAMDQYFRQGGYKWNELATHPGIIYFPYGYGTTNLFEFYSMSIPIFSPSLHLLVQWQLTKPFMNSYLWPTIPHNPTYATHPFSPVEQTRQALEYWLSFSDMYQFPHIEYFNSFDDLMVIGT